MAQFLQPAGESVGDSVSSVADEGRRAHELALLEEAAAALARSTDESEIHRHLVRAAALIVSAPESGEFQASLHLVDGDTIRTVAQYSSTGTPAGPLVYSLADHPVLDAVVHSGRPASGAVADMPQPESLRLLVRRLGLVATALIPVSIAGRVVAVLSVTSSSQHAFSDSEMRRLEAIGHLAGLAIANVERFAAMAETAATARSLEHAKSRFLNLASHEMRGPLTVIAGYTAMLRSGDFGPLDERLESIVLPAIETKVAELGRIVDRMLTTARIEDDHTALSTIPVDLRMIVDGLIDEPGPLLPGQLARVTLHNTGAPVMVLADPAAVITVLANLVDNACKFGPGDSPVLVEVGRDDSHGVVDVIDHGPGIAVDEQSRLFTRFGRIVTPDNAHVSGTGLGLWLSRELARRQQGDVVVASQPGAGSAFTLRLPLVPVAAMSRSG